MSLSPANESFYRPEKNTDQQRNLDLSSKKNCNQLQFFLSADTENLRLRHPNFLEAVPFITCLTKSFFPEMSLSPANESFTFQKKNTDQQRKGRKQFACTTSQFFKSSTIRNLAKKEFFSEMSLSQLTSLLPSRKEHRSAKK
ncbi:hypothetical protein CEXT_313301 [Caerostris extrusa]|uniref:Uncharacterized protein n=1 Tax=Caerostris extrusa TaxID=172846 RepID=A0AAV4XRM7_CAEEX|nr:hypothetical protein CEXT_313301 [Caerostris extrusa]